MQTRVLSKIFIIIAFIPAFGFANGADTLPEHFEKTTLDAFDSKGILILEIGTVATLVAHQFDQQTRDGAKDHQWMSPSFSKVGEVWGNGIPEVLALGTQYIFDPDDALAGIEGFVLGSVAVQGLKYSAHRERPDASESVSFPSGHTQASFSLAASMAESYGWKKSIPFWFMGVFTGLSRISDDKHWLSDVTAGATIGILFGRAAFGHHSLIPTVLFNNGQPAGGLIDFHQTF